MRVKKIGYLIALFFYRINASEIYIRVLNQTNFPALIKQNGSEKLLCGSSKEAVIKVIRDVDLQCFVCRRKRRGCDHPIILTPDQNTTHIRFFRRERLIIGECSQYTSSSESERE